MPAAHDPGRRPLPPDLARLLHDLRGPLNSITMHAQLLKRAVGDDATAEDSASTVLEQVRRLSDMLADAFAVAALERGALRTVDLAVVAESARKDVGASVTLADGPWPSVHGDEALLTLALGHLLRNAVEATAAACGGRTPLVSAAVEAKETVVSVRDWGPGLPSADPKVVIRPFHSTKRGHRGLGLVTVERIARLHNGALRLTALSDGALVTLALPSGR